VASRIDTIVDYLATVLQAADLTAMYHSEDVMQIFDQEFFDGMTGRNVWIETDSFENQNVASRNKDFNNYTLRITGVMRWTEPGLPPKAWQRDLKLWFQGVFDRATDIRNLPASLATAGLTEKTWPQSAQWVEVMDKLLIVSHKLFWSEMTVTFQRAE